MRNITNIKRIVITIVAIAIGYFVFQSITSSATAVAKQENPVQLVSTQPETEIKKAVPVRLNGQEEKWLILLLMTVQESIRHSY